LPNVDGGEEAATRMRADRTFVGRRPLLRKIEDGLTRPEPLVIYDVQGTGGVGKTALLDELAVRLLNSTSRTLRVSFADYVPEAERDRGEAQSLSAYRRILETLESQLPGRSSEHFKTLVGKMALGATDKISLDVARDEITEAFTEQVKGGGSAPPVIVLGDDISSLLPGEVATWIIGLLRKMSQVAPVTAVLTRSGAPDERIAYPGRVDVVPLGPLTSEETARLVAKQSGDDAWVGAIERWCGHYPAAVVLASELAADYPDRPEVLEDTATVLPRGGQLVDMLVSSLGGGLQQTAVEVAAVARRFDGKRVRSVLGDLELTAPPDLETWLDRLPFVEALDENSSRIRPFLRLLLGERLRAQAPRRSATVGNRLEELHRLLADARREVVDEYAQDRTYSSWLRYEDPAMQESLLEFLYHAFHLPNERAWFYLAFVYLDGFWWWGEYLESDFCRRVLEAWEQRARPEDRPVLDALWAFQRWHPQAATKDQGSWKSVENAIKTICEKAGLDRDEGKLNGEESHVRALLEVYRGECHAVLHREDRTADELFALAIGLFGRRNEDSWCIPWVNYEQAKLKLARDECVDAERIATEALHRAVENVPEEERDFEIEANLYRVLGDACWKRNERWSAFRYYAKAVLSAYVFNAVPDPPDDYTRTFYREITDHALNRVLSLMPDKEAALRACKAFAAMWEPYWKLTGKPPEARGMEALLDQEREVAVCLFPPEPADSDIDQDGPYAEIARRVYAQLKDRLDEAVAPFGPESLLTRLKLAFRGRPDHGVTLALEVPSGPAEPEDLFEPENDPIWPDHWRSFPPEWRELAEDDMRRDTIRALVGRAIENLPEGWRTVLELRDREGWTYQDVARRHGISRTNQTIILHHARARIRRTLADFFKEEAAHGHG